MLPLTKEEISELIKQKEERDKVFEHEEQERAKETEIIYHRIKDLFLKYVIEESILRGYVLTDIAYEICLWKAIVETSNLDFNHKFLFGCNNAKEMATNLKENKKETLAAFKFQQSYDRHLLDKNLTKLLLSNGFEKLGNFGFKTSKKALLGESKIPEYVAHKQAEANDIVVDTKTTGLLAFIGLLIAVGVMCWLKSIY